MPRRGSFRSDYSIDDFTPLPRPFQVEGEGESQRAVPLKAPAPPQKPNIPPAREAQGKVPRIRLYSKEHLRQFPHLRDGFRRVDTIADRRRLSRNLARFLTGDKNAKAGQYLRRLKGYRYDPLTGRQTIPVYVYKRIPDSIWEKLTNAERYKNDPKVLMDVARFLYRQRWNEAYWAMVRFVKFWTLRIREQQQDAKREQRRALVKWRQEYEAYRRKQLQQWRDDQRWWNER